MTAAYVPVSEIDASAPPPDVALVLPTLYSGGAERVHLNLAEYFVGRGLRVDLVVGKYFGSLKDKVPPGVRVISLDARRVLLSLPQYLRYLAAARPPVVLSSVENISIVACLGKLTSSHHHKLVVRVDNSLKRAGSLLFQPRRWGWIAAVAGTFWKADALIAVSRGLAQSCAGTGVTVNAVLPGPTRSAGVEEFAGQLSGGKPFAEFEKEFFKTIRPSSLLKRFAMTEEVANLVTYVCSPLSVATNGAALRVDGGVVQSCF